MVLACLNTGIPNLNKHLPSRYHQEDIFDRAMLFIPGLEENSIDIIANIPQIHRVLVPGSRRYFRQREKIVIRTGDIPTFIITYNWNF